MQRAKALVLGKQGTTINRTGDYFVEKRFGGAPVKFRGVEVKPCCSQTISSNIATVLLSLLFGGVVDGLIIPPLPDAIINGPLIKIVSDFMKHIERKPVAVGVDGPFLKLSTPSSSFKSFVDVVEVNTPFLDDAKIYIDKAFESSPLQEQINNDAQTIISMLKDNNGTNQVYERLASLQKQLGTTKYAQLVEAFSPLIYG